MSNSQTWAETFAPIETHNREIVNQYTWGHLAAVKHTTYKGYILFAKSSFCSGIVLIDYEFDGLDSSPWLYEAVHEHLDTIQGLKEGHVYKITGSIRNYRITGKAIQIPG